jgi:hypothetical protein
MLIFKEGGKPENPEKIPRGKGENNTSHKLNSHMVPASSVRFDQYSKYENREAGEHFNY